MAKYNPKTVKQICTFLEEGLSQKDASRLSGISESTLYEWISTKSELSESVELANLKYKQKLLTYANVYAMEDGKLALEILARKWPHEFGRKDTLPVPKEKEETHVTEETAKALLETWDEMKKLRERREESVRQHKLDMANDSKQII